MKKKNKKKIKVIIIDNINKSLKYRMVIELLPGYANYLISQGKAVVYTPYNEYLIQQANTKEIADHTKEYEILSQYLNNLYLHIIRASNKSQTLYGKISRSDIVTEIIAACKSKNVPQNLIDIFTQIKIDSIILSPDIKTSNMLYTLSLVGNFDGIKIHLCVAGTKEECEALETASLTNSQKGGK